MGLEVNKRITECREKAKIKKKQVAEQIGMKYSTYCAMENKNKRFDLETLELIAKALDVSVDYLLYGHKNYDFTPIEPSVLVAESPNKGKSPFDDPIPPVVKYNHKEFILSSEEKALITFFRNLSKDNKLAVREFIEELNK